MMAKDSLADESYFDYLQVTYLARKATPSIQSLVE